MHAKLYRLAAPQLTAAQCSVPIAWVNALSKAKLEVVDLSSHDSLVEELDLHLIVLAGGLQAEVTHTQYALCQATPISILHQHSRTDYTDIQQSL